MSPMRFVRIAALLFGLGALAPCGPGRKFVTISLIGVPPDTSSVQISSSLNGVPARTPSETFTSHLDEVIFSLPPQVQGQLELRVEAMDGDTCLLASGQGELSIDDGQHYSLSITLELLSVVACPLTVSQTGEGAGTVVSDPQGISCGAQCTARFPVGTSVGLTVMPSSFSYLDGWSGACSGSGPCKVSIGGPAQAGAHLLHRPAVCSQNLCWENPLPRSASITGLWGASSQDLWAIGNTGNGPLVLHFDGRTWSVVDSGVQNAGLNAIWGRTAKDIWIVGDPALAIHWDGTSWKPTGGLHGTLNGVWGSGPNDVWVVGADNSGMPKAVSFHFTGSTWDEVAVSGVTRLSSVFGTSQTNVFAVGDEFDSMAMKTMGTVYVLRGGAWQVLYQIPGQFNALWATEQPTPSLWVGGTNFPAMGPPGIILRYDGNNWTTFTGFDTVSRLWGTRSDDVWALGPTLLHSTGGGFTAVNSPLRSGNAVWAAAPDQVWAADSEGEILHLDGKGWTNTTSVTANDLTALWGSSANDLWAVGAQGTLLHRDDQGWTNMQGVTSGTLSGIWGSGPNDVWAVGDQGIILHWTGSSWGKGNQAAAQNLYGIWGSGQNDVWAVGDNALLHWDGSAWTPAPDAGGAYLRGVWGSRPNDVWAVGGDGPKAKSFSVALHWDGSRWGQANLQSSREPLTQIWGSRTDDIWAISSDQFLDLEYGLFHWDGMVWSLSRDKAVRSPRALWGSGPHDVWIADDFRGLFHWIGGSWLQQPSPFLPRGSVNAMWGLGPGTFWLVGNSGLILRYRP